MYVDAWIRTNRTFKLHNFNTKWTTVGLSLLKLAAEGQQEMWMIWTTLTGVKHHWMESEDTYRDDRYLIDLHRHCDNSRSFQNLWIIFVQILSIQNHTVWLNKCINVTHSYFWHKSCQRKPHNLPCCINSTPGLHCCIHPSNVLMNVSNTVT